MNTTRVRFLSFFLLLTLLSIARPDGANAQTPTPARFTVTPAAGSATSPAGGYFVVPSTAGSAAQQVAVLENKGTGPVEVRLGSVDAATTAGGGMAYRTSDAAPALAGRWLHLERTTVTIAPGTQTRVPFRIEVPADARPGRHFAGLAAWVPSDGQGATVSITTRQVLPVVVVLPGPQAAQLDVAGVDPLARPDGLQLAVDITNRGTDLVAGTGTLSVDGGAPKPITFDQVVPDTSFAYLIPNEPLPDGNHDIAVQLSYDGRTTDWRGSLRIGQEVRNDLIDRAADDQITATPSQPNGTDPKMLALGLGGLGPALAFAVAALVRRRQRDRTNA